MNFEVGSNRQALRRMAFITVVAILISVPLTFAGMIICFGTDPNATIPVRSAFEYGVSAAVLVPSLICPITCYKIVMVIRERDRAHSELRRVSQTDQLTGLFNRRGFDAFARDLISEWELRNPSMSILMIDVDFFKAVNDSLGHEFGDAALVHIASILKDEAEARRFIVGRQGGEEFIAMLPGLTGSQAAVIAERLRLVCSDKPVVFNGRSKAITVSIGIASRHHSLASLSQLISEADLALYEAKKQGRNRIVLHRPISTVASAA